MQNPLSRGEPSAQPPAGGKIDRNYAKQLISDNLEIINNCFGVNVPKSVQKLGLFEIQDILNDFKSLYRVYVETFLGMDPDVRVIILGKDETLKDEEIYFSLGSNSDNYRVKSNPYLFDKNFLSKALTDYISENKIDYLERPHIDLIEFITDKELKDHEHDYWLRGSVGQSF